MKLFIRTYFVLFIAATTALVATAAQAEFTVTQVDARHAIIEGTADSVATKMAKDGSEYTMIRVSNDKQLAGITFADSSPIMAFQESNELAKSVVAGDKIRALVEVGEYRGKPSYRLLGFPKAQ